ncbi:glycosyl hydrolases family 18-domain-containing protein [Lasiosphaeria hispida]|uniref:chitinase n=1 Tax=Lasiosphaeria hispida TaxID=260671 RepID=A0AAJ0HWR9_9PEZI|nr:glycosyl hydrolases family 18-domain-containing protein [Lasiosphaeria hispida]
MGSTASTPTGNTRVPATEAVTTRTRPTFVLLMKTLRTTFDASPRPLGLTFTIPSSFWYLRWFDMPGLLQYAGWINLMSYDLHGTWDEHNPVGAIAQAHTNLTEIKLAMQLLWRVGVKPEQVVLGYGFYGRAFELANPSCNTPGCPFAGGAKKGPCSNEAGILMYYEPQAILQKYPNLEPVFDEEAAVKYVTWDNSQWISYDDADTFVLKLEWANEMGFGGSMIWAVHRYCSSHHCGASRSPAVAPLRSIRCFAPHGPIHRLTSRARGGFHLRSGSGALSLYLQGEIRPGSRPDLVMPG